jgi:AcrR family transcriptional regulator
MARPATNHEERKSQIIEAALKTFAKYGYEGTTNKLIAQEAGKIINEGEKQISPALIYHYFPNGKQELFIEAMKTRPQLHELTHAMLDSMDLPPEQFFRKIATTYYGLIKDETLFAVVRLALIEAPHHPEVSSEVASQIVPVFLLPLVSYFVKQQAMGVLKEMRPDQLAMSLFGPMVMRRLILGVVDPHKFPIPVSSDEEFIEGIVSNFLDGVLV